MVYCIRYRKEPIAQHVVEGEEKPDQDVDRVSPIRTTAPRGLVARVIPPCTARNGHISTGPQASTDQLCISARGYFDWFKTYHCWCWVRCCETDIFICILHVQRKFIHHWTSHLKRVICRQINHRNQACSQNR